MFIGRNGELAYRESVRSLNGIYNGVPTQPTIYGVPNGGIKYVVSMTDDFDTANRYDEVVALLANATEFDEIWWNIASNGGFVDSLQMLLGWKAMCPAKQYHVLHANADSCASVFFLSPADQYIVGDGATMFCHEIQAGASGTTSNVDRRVQHLVKQNNDFVRKTYHGFLSDSEIEDVLKGAEIYLDANEIRDRLTARHDIYLEQSQRELDEEVAKQNDLTQYSDEELTEEIELCRNDIKDYQKELKKRKGINK